MTPPASTPPVTIVSSRQLAWRTHSHGDRYAARRKQLGMHGEQLGCSLYELDVGMAAWPSHHHFANEEALFILEGRGTLYMGAHEDRARFELASGDYVALRRGDARHAHKLVNEGEQVLRYLCFSTQHVPEIIGYPDSSKVGLMAGAAPGGDATQRTLSVFLDSGALRDYWDGE